MYYLIRLRADTEDELIAALPWFRDAGEDGEPMWVLASHHHAFDPIGALELTPPRLLADGIVEVGDVDTRYHANLLLDDAHPFAATITAAVEPFRCNPSDPRRTFA